GEYIARAISVLGFGLVRGSTTSGARRALRNMVNQLKQGAIIAITPDGPRGPRYQAQTGVAYLAAKANVPVIPASNSASSRIHLTSWDRFLIPLPFSRIKLIIGPPIYPQGVSSSAIASLRDRIESELNLLTREADRSIVNL
ncbi:DUF374 domain-containing protein, partial [bacterium]|nr:DUF374 domain-containing protein [bacterium]